MRRPPSWLARMLRRPSSRRVVDRSSAAAPPPEPGPRRESWLVVGPGRGSVRSARLAVALAARGVATTYVSRAPDDDPPRAADGLRVLETWSLAGLREAYTRRTDRLRILFSVADAETIALARDLASCGARTLYDAPPPTGPPPGPLSYDAQTERALIDAVEDLIGADARTARHVSTQAGGGRLVHVLADAEGAAGWDRAAQTLLDIAAPPSVTVLLATGRDAAETIDATKAFESARGDAAYRLAVVASARDPASEALEALEEAGRVSLFRSAREGRAAAWNLGLSATRGEFVALVHATQRPDGIGWLAPAVETLTRQRELGAVGVRSLRPPGAVGEAPEGLGPPGGRVPAIDGPGLVAPRSVLRRAGGFDETFGEGGLASVDLSFRIRDLGLGVALCPALGLRGGEPPDAASDGGIERELRRRWSHRPAYLTGRIERGG